MTENTTFFRKYLIGFHNCETFHKVQISLRNPQNYPHTICTHTYAHTRIDG